MTKYSFTTAYTVLEVMKIYIDVFFVFNFLIDYLSLYASGRFLFLSVSARRLSLGSLLGALWSVIFLFLPSLFFLHLPIAWLMAVISFGQKSVKATALFLLTEMAFGGITEAFRALFVFLPERGVKLGAFITLIGIAFFSFYDLYKIYIKKRINAISVRADLVLQGKIRQLNILIDSGNLAVEATTKRRVIFVKEKRIFRCEKEKERFLESVRLIAVPIKTAAGERIKYGFIPEKIIFSDKKYNCEKFMIVPDTEGCEFGGFDGIIGVV